MTGMVVRAEVARAEEVLVVDARVGVGEALAVVAKVVVATVAAVKAVSYTHLTLPTICSV
eukprot:6700747-Prymnesium_polylepis.1